MEGLVWENYSKDAGTLNITRSIWSGVVSEPKTESSQAPVPVIKPLNDRLELHRFRAGNPQTGPIFRTTNPDTGGVVPLNFDNLTKRQIVASLNRCVHCEMSEDEHKAAAKHKRWKKPDHAYERKESLPRWRGWHAFRRGLATNLYRLGATDKTVQGILRHKHVMVTREHYIKTVKADVTAAMKQLESNIGGLSALNAPLNAPRS